MSKTRKIANADVANWLKTMAAELKALIAADASVEVIGIHTGGVWVAQHLCRLLKHKRDFGQLNIAFYRDDFSRIGVHPSVARSNLPFPVEDQHIILIDDILYTGRTIRAAMNEIFDYGRPASIRLAVLIDRSGRELPIQADVVGTTLSLKEGEHVKLVGPDPLELVIQNRPA